MADVAGGTSSSKLSEIDKEECKPPLTVESKPSTLRGTAEDRYVTSADESLGLNYPNINEEVRKKVIDPTEESGITHWQGLGSRSRSRRRTVKSSSGSDERKDFPPLLSTLNINGLKRYDIVRSVEDGRLKIQIMPNQRPEVVAKVDESGRLRLIFITSQSQVEQDEGEDEDEDEDEDDDEIEERK